MGTDRDKVVVAMSGGVDSSVAACLLREQGYEVIGLFMRSGVPAPPAEPENVVNGAGRLRQGCCSASDAADARFVAGMLGIPFYSLNFEQEFEDLIDYFAAEYERGRTPNPCVVCNTRLKFGRLYDYADAVGARYVATGHYARIETRDGQKQLCRGLDRAKDQSYVLFDLPVAGLDRVLFPIGEQAKDQVRAEARRFGLPVSDKPDSVEICFVPDRDYARVVRERRPDAFRPGDVIDRDGHVVGRHRGVAHYTVGQRRGLGIAAGRPIYVTDVNAATNTVTIGDADALRTRHLTANRANFLTDAPETFRATAKIRYLHPDAPATIERIAERTVRVTFDDPQRAVTPGQAVVFYDGDVVLGGGWIVAPRND
jgi:tRNA-specific 2-thiouridylase